MKGGDKRFLITGGAGFIGSNLCEAFLAEGREVVCLDNLATGLESNLADFSDQPRFRFIRGDIRDLDTCIKAMDGVDVVLHQAALGSVPRSIDDPLTTNDVNISGFLNVLEAARKSEVRRVIYAASSSTYGDSRELPKVEERIGNPLSPYAVTKLVNELYAKVYGDLYGMELIGLRYFNVFGRRQRPDGAYAAAIPRFIQAFIAGESPVIHGDGGQTRDFTYIENVIQANRLAVEVENPQALNQVYNVAYGAGTSVVDLVEMIRAALKNHLDHVSEVPVEFGPGRRGDVRDSLADISKARELLGYRPSHSIREGLEEAIGWYLEDFFEEKKTS